MQQKSYVIGLLQAVGVTIYCLLVSLVFSLLRRMPVDPPALLTMSFMLLFLVFSASVTGALVFAYPVYLAMNKEIKKALHVLLYTLLFCFIFGGLALFLLFLIVR